MATNKPILRKRTIQHPGFEFFETDMSIYKEYQQNTDALVVGYFAKGPILEPVALANLSDYTVYFGVPSSEAEIYAYSGIEKVINSGGTVTAMRLPYNNASATIPSDESASVETNYKVLLGTIGDLTGDLAAAGALEDLEKAYKGGVSFKNIKFTPTTQTYKQIVDIINGNSSNDMVIINKYHDYKTPNGTEYFVSVLGAGNVIRHQGLNVDLTDESELKDINLYKVTNGENDFIGKDSEQLLKVCKDNDLWQSSGEIDDNGIMKSVAQVFPEKLLSYFDQLSTMLVEVHTHGKLTGSFTIPTAPTNETPAEISTPIVVSFVDKDSQPYNPVQTDYDLQVLTQIPTGTKIVYVDAGKCRIEFPSGKKLEATFADTTVSFEVAAQTEDTQSVINPKKDDFISVVVSKVKPSALEAGKFDIEVVESFNGSIFPNSIDSVSQESNYIGTLINENSNFISFYGKKDYGEKYSKDENTILIADQEAFGLSWAEGQKFDGSDSGIKLTKAVTVADAEGNEIDWTKLVLRPALEKLKNNIKFVFRDFYDFGMSSVPLYLTSKTKEYNPTASLEYPTSSDKDIKITAWKKIQKACTQFCQYKHKLSMFHGDAPRGLVLNGTLSKIDDLREDAMNKIFTPKVTQKVSIKDSTYGQVNVQWYEIIDMFNKTKMWIPSSIILAGDITNNDINGNVWDAPAGHRYGLVTNVIRPAFNPDADLADRLYSNCLNYGNSWPTGTMTVEGQKTSYAENSALNRINVRRLMIWLERFTQNVSAGYIYEPNTASTRDNFVAELDTEFSRCKILGGLYDYKLVCDESNNSPEVIDRNELRIFIAVQPTRTVEYILANFSIFKTGANLEEVSPVF